MDVTYQWAKLVVNTANLNFTSGGTIASILNNFVDANSLNLTLIPITLKDNVAYTFSHSGYPVWITFFVIWFICLIMGCGYLWHMRCRSLRKLASSSNQNGKRLPKKQPKFRLKSIRNKTCALILISIFSLLLLTFIVLGIISIVHLYVNVSARVTSSGVLLSPKLIDEQSPNRMLLFPRIFHALSTLDSYLANFVESTLEASEPYVEKLVNATMDMQDESSREFATLLEKLLGTDTLTNNSQQLIHLMIRIHALLARMSSLDKQFQTLSKNLTKLFNDKFDLKASISCPEEGAYVKRCEELSNDIIYFIHPEAPKNIIFGKLPVDFVLAGIKMDDMEKKQRKAALMKEEQLQKNKAKLLELIDIPSEVRKEAMGKWIEYQDDFMRARELLKVVAINVSRDVQPQVVKYVSIFVGVYSLVWPLLIAVAVFLFWLTFRYFWVQSEIASKSRINTRTIGSVCLVLLSFCLIFMMLIFLAGGYTFTENCRYFDQQRTMMRDGEFTLDPHINRFIDWFWPTVEASSKRKAQQENKTYMPLPRPKNLIKGLAVCCRDNVGVLNAFDAVKSYDFSATYDPTLSNRIIDAGRKVLMESLDNLNLDSIITNKERAELTMTDQLETKFDIIPLTNMSFFNIKTSSLNLDQMNEFVEELWNIVTPEGQKKLQLFKDTFQLIKTQLESVIDEMKKTKMQYNSLGEIAKLGSAINTAIDELNKKLSNKDALKKEASALFEREVVNKTEAKGIKQMKRFGPTIMGAAGPCNELHVAFEDLNYGVCHGIVGPLNGIWVFTLFCLLFASFGLLFGLVTMVHRMPEPGIAKSESLDLLRNPSNDKSPFPAYA
ncbi:hypothetical protein Ciccas_000831 [Cichlidogyrus casuarinus]|uniref:Prominin-like protein n=1 Tax=Cichlidogyrus casuarinus TaxID=1844966 RepID=A0ABD2QLR4_9PLAT